MEFTFTKEAQRQALLLQLEALSCEEVLEKDALVESLIAQGWVEYKQTLDEASLTYWWIVHPSVSDLDWEHGSYIAIKDVDTSLYYDLFT